MSTPPPSPSTKRPSEELLNERWDTCLSNGIIRAGMGLGVGIVGSVLFFKRRAWPVYLSTGFGLGVAYAECDALFKESNKWGVRQERREVQGTAA